jgi:hypothetical protein
MDRRLDREREWSRNWARSATTDQGIQVIGAYQRRRQTLIEIVIISSLIGIFGNLVADAVTTYPLRLELLTFAILSMVVSIIIFLMVNRKYGPHQPARITAHLDYHTLLDSYDRDCRNLIEYVMAGAGLREFEPFAKQVLEESTKYFQAVAFRSKTGEPRSKVRSFDGRTSEVRLTVELDEVASARGLKGVKTTLDLILYESSIGHDPVRTHGVNFLVIFTIRNPEHPLADEFVSQVIEPAMPQIAVGLSYALKTELPILKIQMLRDIIQHRHQQCLDKNITDDWYLLNSYPYDGDSKTLLVIDKSLVRRNSSYGSVLWDPILAVLRKTDLWGSYVTDCDEWSSIRKLPHLLEEMIYVKPVRIITIGKRSKRYVDRHLQRSQKKTQVVNLLKNVTKIDDQQKLSEELTKSLDGIAVFSAKVNGQST